MDPISVVKLLLQQIAQFRASAERARTALRRDSNCAWSWSEVATGH